VTPDPATDSAARSPTGRPALHGRRRVLSAPPSKRCGRRSTCSTPAGHSTPTKCSRTRGRPPAKPGRQACGRRSRSSRSAAHTSCAGNAVRAQRLLQRAAAGLAPHAATAPYDVNVAQLMSWAQQAQDRAMPRLRTHHRPAPNLTSARTSEHNHASVDPEHHLTPAPESAFSSAASCRVSPLKPAHSPVDSR
jgi:hypothetical protein